MTTVKIYGSCDVVEGRSRKLSGLVPLKWPRYDRFYQYCKGTTRKITLELLCRIIPATAGPVLKPVWPIPTARGTPVSLPMASTGSCCLIKEKLSRPVSDSSALTPVKSVAAAGGGTGFIAAKYFVRLTKCGDPYVPEVPATEKGGCNRFRSCGLTAAYYLVQTGTRLPFTMPCPSLELRCWDTPVPPA